MWNKIGVYKNKIYYVWMKCSENIDRYGAGQQPNINATPSVARKLECCEMIGRAYAVKKKSRRGGLPCKHLRRYDSYL